MKKKLKYIIVVLMLALVYMVGGKVLDKMYLGKFSIYDYTGSSRFTTVNKVIEKRFNKAKTAILVNTERIDQVVTVSPYAYAKDYPVFYTEKERVLKPIYDQMAKLGVKNVIIIGGVNQISESAQRGLERNGYKTERIVESPGIDMSIKIANLLNITKKSNSIIVTSEDEFDLPNAISASPFAQSNNIPIIVMNNSEKDIIKLEKYIRENGIKKSYIVSNNNYINTNLEKILPDVSKIEGKDRYSINTKIMNTFYKNEKNKKVYISKGGELLHKRHLGSGQLINAMAISPLAADNKAPLMFIENNYFSTEDNKIIKSKGYKEINEVGFKIERRKFFNVERFKVASTLILIIVSLLIVARILKPNVMNL